MSGCVAGTAATAVSFPFDVLRTRMIGQGKPKVLLIFISFNLQGKYLVFIKF